MKFTTFEIHGNPKGKDRPRFTRNGHAYTTKSTRDYEQMIKLEYSKQSNEYFEGEVSVIINVGYPIPKSITKKELEDIKNGAKPAKKPDCDNVAKVILDSLNGIAYKDDKQVVALFVRKEYMQNPKTKVCIVEYEH